jgi:uncharacterized membrane protein
MPQTFFTPAEQLNIVAAIKEAEAQTSGEIKVHIECCVDGLDVVEKAKQVFDRLELEKTQDRNGILIYIAKDDRKLAIYGDAGINRVVPEGYWESTKDLMQSYFKVNQFAEGTLKGIHMVGKKLITYFPIKSGDKNEISNEISFGNSAKS